MRRRNKLVQQRWPDLKVKLEVQLRQEILCDKSTNERRKIFGLIGKGWPAVLSSLKNFVETGRGLEPSFEEGAARRAVAEDAA
jgi:hypothetical protein